MWNLKIYLHSTQGSISRRSTGSRPCCSTSTTSTTAVTWLSSWPCSSNPSPWTKSWMWYKTWCKSRAFGRVVLLKSSFAMWSYQTCSTWRSFKINGLFICWTYYLHFITCIYTVQLGIFYDEMFLATSYIVRSVGWSTLANTWSTFGYFW